MAENPIKYSDFISPDGSVTDLIKQLEELQKTYTEMLSKVRQEAGKMLTALEKANGATEAGKGATDEAAQAAERLKREQEKLTKAQSEAGKEIAKLKVEQQKQNNVNKLQIRLAESLEGSYDKLSAQYSLNKLSLNAMSAAERNGTKSGKALEAQTKDIYQEMNRLQKATGKHTLEVGNYKLATENLHPALGRVNQGLGVMGTSLTEISSNKKPFAALTAGALTFGRAALAFMLSPIGLVLAALGGLYYLIKGNKDTVIEFNSNLINVGKTANLTGEDLRGLGQSVVWLSRRLKVIGVNALLEYATVAGQLGVKGTANILLFTESLAKLQTATDIAGQEGATNIARLLTLTDGGVQNIKDFGDEITNLGNNFAATENEILTNATAIAQNTGQYKIGRQTVLAYATATKAVGLEAEITGSTIGRTLGLIEKAVRTGKDIDTVAKLTGKNVEDLKKQFKEDPGAVFSNFVKGLNDVYKSGGSVNGTLEEIGITAIRDQRVISSLATRGFNVLDGSIKAVAASSGSLDKEFAAASNKLRAQLSRVGIAWDNLILTIEDGQGFLSSIAAFFAGSFAEAIDKAAYNILLFGAAFSGLEASAKALGTGLSNLLTNLKNIGIAFTQFFKSFSSLGTIKIDLSDPIGSLLSIKTAAADVVGSLGGLKTSFTNISVGFPSLGDAFSKAYSKELKRGTDAIKEENKRVQAEVEKQLEESLASSILSIEQLDEAIKELRAKLQSASTAEQARPIQDEIKDLEAKRDAILGVASANLKEIETRKTAARDAEVSIMADGEGKDIVLLEIELEEKRKLFEKYGLDLVLLEDFEKRQRAAITKKYDDQSKAKEKEAADAVIAEDKRVYDNLVRILDQEATLKDSEIDLLKTTEAEKTRLRLEAERDRLQQVLALNRLIEGQLSEMQIGTIKNTIKKIDQEIKQVGNDDLDIYSMVGLNLNDDQKQGISNSVNYVLGNIKSILDARVQAADRTLSKLGQEKSEIEARYQQEIEARQNGYASQVEGVQRELALNKKKEKEALKEKQKAQRAQAAIDTAMQITGLLTASVEIWKSLSGIAVVGPALAAAAVGTMFASFAASKIKSKSVATQQYGEGGLEILEGGSHASGKDIPIGTTRKGKRRTAEGGEALAIVNKRNTRKYRGILPSLIKSLNAGTFENSFSSAFLPEAQNENVFVNSNFDSPELKSMSQDLSAIRKQGHRQSYKDSKGRLVETYKNLKITHV
jgi:TP901 family phage tail tape measure protein